MLIGACKHALTTPQASRRKTKEPINRSILLIFGSFRVLFKNTNLAAVNGGKYNCIAMETGGPPSSAKRFSMRFSNVSNFQIKCSGFREGRWKKQRKLGTLRHGKLSCGERFRNCWPVRPGVRRLPALRLWHF